VLSALRALLAAAMAAVQFLYLATVHPFNERLTIAVTVGTAYAAWYLIEVMWNFIVIAPVKWDENRRHQATNDAVKIRYLKGELQEAFEWARPKVGFQLKSEKPRRAPNGLDAQLPGQPTTLSPLRRLE
jgi:hypothetical protein